MRAVTILVHTFEKRKHPYFLNQQFHYKTIGGYKLSPSIVGTYKNEESLNIYYFNCAAKLANEFKVP